MLPGRGQIDLTHTEMLVLRVLMASANQAVDRNQLLSVVWSDDGGNSSNIVDVYIRRLRKKLEEDLIHPQYILSVRGIGYKFIGK
jgi:DNA-binding response OmpR family regulator